MILNTIELFRDAVVSEVGSWGEPTLSADANSGWFEDAAVIPLRREGDDRWCGIVASGLELQSCRDIQALARSRAQAARRIINAA
jgi:hypothetical protein